MSEVMEWLQMNWYEAGSLTVQVAILGALVWYGRKAVNAIWAIWVLQAQGGPNVRAEVDDVSIEQPSEARVRYAAPRKRVSVLAAVGAAFRAVHRWLNAPVRGGRQGVAMHG